MHTKIERYKKDFNSERIIILLKNLKKIIIKNKNKSKKKKNKIK